MIITLVKVMWLIAKTTIVITKTVRITNQAAIIENSPLCPKMKSCSPITNQ